uniref:RING-type domain-containing protein n=1 Tax=Panagrolaimus superbus TaxID=310955 RepID=A0A914XYG8_9BILA
MSTGLAPAPSLNEQETKCPLCLQDFSSPKVLACFHSFCKQCLLQHQTCEDRVTCPLCQAETLLTPQLGVDGLLNDYGLQNICERRICKNRETPPEKSPASSASASPSRDDGPCNLTNNNNDTCASCKNGDRVKAHCRQCGYLCDNCRMAHQFMHCFEGHEIQLIDVNADQQVDDQQIQKMEMMVNEAAKKQQEVLETFRFIDDAQTRLHMSHQHAISTIHESSETLISLVHELRQSLINDLDAKFGLTHVSLLTFLFPL